MVSQRQQYRRGRSESRSRSVTSSYSSNTDSARSRTSTSEVSSDDKVRRRPSSHSYNRGRSLSKSRSPAYRKKSHPTSYKRNTPHNRRSSSRSYDSYDSTRRVSPDRRHRRRVSPGRHAVDWRRHRPMHRRMTPPRSSHVSQRRRPNHMSDSFRKPSSNYGTTSRRAPIDQRPRQRTMNNYHGLQDNSYSRYQSRKRGVSPVSNRKDSRITNAAPQAPTSMIYLRRPYRHRAAYTKFTVDRTKICPFLLRVFYRSDEHYPLETYNLYLNKDASTGKNLNESPDDTAVTENSQNQVVEPKEDNQNEYPTNTETIIQTHSPTQMQDDAQGTPVEKPVADLDEPIKDDIITEDKFFNSELQLYVWKDSTLREIVDLVKDLCPQTRVQNTRISFKLLQSNEQNQLQFFDLGTLHSSRPHPDDRRTLHSSPLEIGDVISVAILTTYRFKGQRRSFMSPNVETDRLADSTPQVSSYDPLTCENQEQSEVDHVVAKDSS